MWLLMAAPLLAGCLTFDTVIRLRPDGSGVVEQTLVLSGAMLDLLTIFGGEAETLDLYTEDDLRAQAAAMGPGVRLSGVAPIERGDARGYTARFAFDAVGALTLEPAPGSPMPAPDGSTPPTPHLTFRFEPGPPATLFIDMPPAPEAAPAAASIAVPAVDSTLRAEQMAELRTLLRGGRLGLAVEINGTVLGTDALHRDGDRITLIDLAFDALALQDSTLLRLSETPHYGAARALLEQVPGIVFEPRQTVRVRFE